MPDNFGMRNGAGVASLEMNVSQCSSLGVIRSYATDREPADDSPSAHMVVWRRYVHGRYRTGRCIGRTFPSSHAHSAGTRASIVFDEEGPRASGGCFMRDCTGGSIIGTPVVFSTSPCISYHSVLYGDPLGPAMSRFTRVFVAIQSNQDAIEPYA